MTDIKNDDGVGMDKVGDVDKGVMTWGNNRDKCDVEYNKYCKCVSHRVTGEGGCECNCIDDILEEKR